MQPLSARLLALIEATHLQLADFAVTSFRASGRGAVRVTFPPSAEPEHASFGIPDVIYLTQRHIRAFAREHPENGDAAALLRMVDTYDPEEHAVVIAAFPLDVPITITMKLDPPTLAKNPGGVH